MLTRVAQITDHILRREEEIRSLALSVREKHPDVFVKVEGRAFTGRIGAVDGGILAEPFHGLDIIMVRAVGVVFEYRDGELMGVQYYPSPLPDPDVQEHDMPFEEDQIGVLRSLVRLRAEIGLAASMAGEIPMDVLFLDGSVLPLLSDRPSGNGKLMELYKQVVELYRQLYRACDKNGVLLAGIVKDSKGNRFGKYLGDIKIRDTRWLSYALFPGERTVSIPYTDDPEKATLKDVGTEYAERVRVFYLRASPYDAPYRVEYLERGDGDDDFLASLLLPLSSLNPTYTIPPFLVEADLRARLGKNEMRHLKGIIERRIGVYYYFMRMRGANKPW